MAAKPLIRITGDAARPAFRLRDLDFHVNAAADNASFTDPAVQNAATDLRFIHPGGTLILDSRPAS